MVGCDDAYIGEESIIRPPAAKNAAITAAHSSRSLASLPTLNVIQLPRPTTGSISPVDGIGLVRGEGFCAPALPASTAQAAVARTPCSAARRVTFMTPDHKPAATSIVQNPRQTARSAERRG